MGRGFFVLLLVVVWWFFPAEKTAGPRATVDAVPITRTAVPLGPTALVVRAPAQIIRPVSLTKNEVAQLPAHDRVPANLAPIRQSGRQWRQLDGVVAVRTSARLPRVSELHGFSLVHSGDVPVGTETFPVVERTDNGMLGVMTGVLKALGDKGAGEFLGDCPGTVVETYPALKSHLLRPSGEPDDFMNCLAALNRFKRLEWEILDRPRGPR
jgi:hypothetical protein